MIKRILTLLLSVSLLMGICVPVLGEEAADVAVSAVTDETADVTVEEEPVVEPEDKTVRHTVVDVADIDVAKKTGLAASAAYTHDADLSLRWSGEDLKRAIPLPITRTDWSDSAYLEFWAYSVIQTDSSFGVVLVSDNPETKEVDYYEASVNAAFKGWYLVSLPFVDFEEVNSPKGFDSIDSIELWPNRGSYSIYATANLYLDSFAITNKQSDTEEISDDLVLFDFTTRDGFARSGCAEDVNKKLMPAPEKETMALRFTDEIRYQRPDDLWLAPSDPDVTGYSHVQLVMYNEKLTLDGFRVVFRSENSAVAGNDYYYYDLALDWTGWKTLQIPIEGFSKATGSELGWNQINMFEFWWQLGGVDDERYKVDTVTYLESVILKNVDPNERFLKPLYAEDIPAVPDAVDVASVIKENFPNNQHPRLLTTQEELDWIKANWQTDEFLSNVIPRFLATCDGSIGKKFTVTGSADSGPFAAGNAEAMALAWKLTGDQKYADECWERIKELTYDASTWASESFALTIGDTSRSIAVVYDLMYHDWTPEQRQTLRNAMILYAINTTKGNIARINGVQTDDSNWTPVGNSGLGMIALVLADEPGYENVTNGYINRLHMSNERFFQNFGPDGSGHEGPDYWNYMMGCYVLYEAALYRSLGSEKSEIFNKFSMTDQWGLENTADFITHMGGVKGTSFNFSDGAARNCSIPGGMWFASFYGRPEQGGQAWETASASTSAIYFYDPDVDYKSWRDVYPLDSAWDEGSPQAGSMRTSWEKGNLGFFVGYKGNNANVASHSRMDTGTFVLENQGERFIVQIDDATYSLPEMFGGMRYQYYRNRAEGSNTLVIGPGVHQGSNTESTYYVEPTDIVDQVYLNVSPIVETGSKEYGAYSIIDMTDAYRATADMAKRGFALVDGRNAFLLQDEITVKKATDVYSFMHTEADIEIAPNGQSAILTQGGKKMKVALLSNCNAKLVDMAAEPFSTTPQVNHEDNSRWRKLTVKASVSSNATFSLLFTPYYGADQYSYTMDKIIPLKDWGSKLLVEPVPLNGIYLDGVLLADFEPGKLVYTLKEDSLGTITVDADSNVNVEIKEATKLGLPTTITATKGSNKTVYVVNYSNTQQEILDSYTTYPVINYYANVGLDRVPRLWDGIMDSGWYNDGSNWVTYDLGAPKKVFEVDMFWDYQDIRQELFTIEVSNDNKNWTRVWEGQSILSDKMEKYKFDEVEAQFVKIHGISNPKSTWTSIEEIWITSIGENFEDVPADHWAFKAINDMAKIALVQGVESGIYSPEAPLSRAAFLTMLSRVYNLAKSDYTGNVPGIAADAWYTPYLETAYKLGLVPEAMLEGGFQPNKNITREEICALAVTFYEYFIRPINGTSLDKFSDNGAISDWARPYVEKCLAMRVIAGMTDTTFEPAANATRAQAATILKRVYIKAN